MEKYKINEDIQVICITASSFPEGIEEAFNELHRVAPGHRDLFGISWPDRNGVITYKAAAREAFKGEAEQLKLERFTIRKGDWASEIILNFMSSPSKIGETFGRLLHHPDLDPKGYCLEMYLNEKDVRCLVGLK